MKFEKKIIEAVLTLLEYQVIDQYLFPINDQEVPHKMYQLPRRMSPEEYMLVLNEN
jgi:hypothetical protein